ncbi:calcium-transporting ATPase 12, plasma membrane-type-like [Argentina anserina]|uniref:calcium-transporting ATPase 12, plasma membrane-type-like n=1 Tax=Argentina anserina TaxID=57926 RepID=UPI0021762E02|nr:calcium-transporting ATPase 12, plasma membrane-type-like [Potentilla anserina]
MESDHLTIHFFFRLDHIRASFSFDPGQGWICTKVATAFMTDITSPRHQFDLESQHRVLLITSSTNVPPRDHWRWIYVILQVRKLLISSRANKPTNNGPQRQPPQLPSDIIPYTIIGTSTSTTGDAQDADLQLTSVTTEILPASPQVSGDVHLIGEDDGSTAATDAKLQRANISKIVAEKDLESLQKFGGVQGIADALASDVQNGISGDEEDVSSRHTVGALFTTKAPVQCFFKLLLQSSNNYIIFLLSVAAVLSIGFGMKEEGPSTGWYEGGIIVFVIIILVVAPSIRDLWLQTQESHAMRQTSGDINLVVDVIRGRSSHEVPIYDVFPGDIVCLKRGSTIPGDGLFVSGKFLVLDDGKVATIDDKKPFLFCGSKVVVGNGRMLVTSVGRNTSWGELMNRVANTPNQAHLPAQLDKVSTGTQIIGISISILILVVLFTRFMIERENNHSGLPDLRGKPTASKEIMSLIEKIVMKPSGRISILTTSLAIFLVGVVEGIPFFVTLAIRYWNKKTLSGKATAQGTLACVTMGSITTICTDKTGVLTLNTLKVGECYIGEEEIKTDYVTGIDTNVREALCNGICTPILTPSPQCNSTEDPLCCCADFNLGMQYEIMRQNCTIIETKGLSTNEEGSGVLLRRKNSSDNDGDMCLHWKGPAPTILAMCSHYHDNKGETKVMDEQRLLVFNQIIEGMQSKYLKTIAFAYRQTQVQMLEENSLILIALLGVRYSCCTGIVEACQEAGVNIILVSEDDVSDLKDIASECGILLNPNRLVVESESFRNSTQVNRMDMADKICLMGNSTPSDRLLLVQCLKEQGHVVAMVGVGTNDAPTLKEADVGIAIGAWSNGVARESSDIIIWDKNVSFLVSIIGCGRCIYSNIQKYIQLELTMNIAWLLITSTTTMCLGQSAIAAIQLIWANMVVTLLGGLALLMEPPTEELMKRPPVKRTESLISKPMWRNIISQALYQTAILVSFLYKGPAIPGISKKVSESIVFNGFVLCQVFNQVNSRELEKKNIFRGIFSNVWFWVALGAILMLQVGFVEIAHIVVGNARLNWAEWGICLLIGIVSWAIDLVVKCATSFILSSASICRTTAPTNVSESTSNLELPLIHGNST